MTWHAEMPTRYNGNKIGERFHVVNMHAENYDVAAKKFKLFDGVEIEDFGNGIIAIVDERVPNEWLRDKACFCVGEGVDYTPYLRKPKEEV